MTIFLLYNDKETALGVKYASAQTRMYTHTCRTHMDLHTHTLAHVHADIDTCTHTLAHTHTHTHTPVSYTHLTLPTNRLV